MSITALRVETVVPSGDHYNIDLVVPSSDHCCIETVPPSSGHLDTTSCCTIMYEINNIITELRNYRHLVITYILKERNNVN